MKRSLRSAVDVDTNPETSRPLGVSGRSASTGFFQSWFAESHPAEVVNNLRVLDNFGVNGGVSPRFMLPHTVGPQHHTLHSSHLPLPSSLAAQLQEGMNYLRRQVVQQLDLPLRHRALGQFLMLLIPLIPRL
jgi:hypothetical protein